jgi:hypothetical protein
MTKHLIYWLEKNNIGYDTTKSGFYIRVKDEKRVVDYITKLGLFKRKETISGLVLIILKDCSIWEQLRSN